MTDSILISPPFFQTYLDLVPEEPLMTLLNASVTEIQSFVKRIPPTKADFSYQSGKWTVREVLQHCIDTERVFAYRALCLARGEQQVLPGFDQDQFAAHVSVEAKNLDFLIEELLLVRKTSILLFTHLRDSDLDRQGRVSDYTINVRTIGCLILGHLRHHFNILTTQYGI
ncbi:DinB family protein [Niabella terrae]